MRLALVTGTAFALAALAIHPAHAVPIAAGSELSIAGADSFTDTSITFTGLAAIHGTSGSFSVLTDCAACVTMLGTLTAGSTGHLYSASEPGLLTALDLSPPATFTPGGTPELPNVTVTGSGTLTLTGFDPTPGSYEVTTQGPHGADVTFSATSVANTVPPPVTEPASALVLASGLGWMALRLRGRRR